MCVPSAAKWVIRLLLLSLLAPTLQSCISPCGGDAVGADGEAEKAHPRVSIFALSPQVEYREGEQLEIEVYAVNQGDEDIVLAMYIGHDEVLHYLPRLEVEVRDDKGLSVEIPYTAQAYERPFMNDHRFIRLKPGSSVGLISNAWIRLDLAENWRPSPGIYHLRFFYVAEDPAEDWGADVIGSYEERVDKGIEEALKIRLTSNELTIEVVPRK